MKISRITVTTYPLSQNSSFLFHFLRQHSPTGNWTLRRSCMAKKSFRVWWHGTECGIAARAGSSISGVTAQVGRFSGFGGTRQEESLSNVSSIEKSIEVILLLTPWIFIFFLCKNLSFKAGPPLIWVFGHFWLFCTMVWKRLRGIFCENFIKKFEGKVGQMCHRSWSLA